MNKTQKAFGVLAAAAVALTAASAQTTTSANCMTFGTNLKLGMRSADVRKMQQVLNSNPATAIATTGVGSKGMETDYFGPATFKAVIKFQELNAAATLTPAGLSKGTGFVGSLTRTALANASCSTSNVVSGNTNTTTTGTNVYSVAQPTGYIITGQAAARLAEIVVSGNGTLTNLTLQRGGVSSNDVLKNVYLYDGAARISDGASVSTTGSIIFNNLSIAVAGSKNLTVKADIGTDSTLVGQAINVALVSATVNGVVVPQNFVGPTLSVASVSTAKVTINGNNTVSSTSINAPQTNYTVWGVSTSVSTRAALLKSLAVKMIGSAPTSSVSNVGLFVDGSKVGSAYPDANGRFTFTPNTTLNTGSHNIEVRADIVGGANRNFYFSVENTADLVAEDSSISGVAAAVAYLDTTAVKNAGTISVNSTSLNSINLAKDTTFTTNNLVKGAANTTIGKFTLAAYGEDTKIQQINVNLGSVTVSPAPVSPKVANLTNVGLFVSGIGQVGSNYTIDTNTSKTYTLGSSFIAQAGVTYTVEVKADLTSSEGAQAVGALQISLGNILAQGVSSQNVATVFTTSPVTGQSLTIGGGDPQFGKTVNGVSANTSANSSNIKIGSFSIQGGSVEDITVKTLALDLSSGTIPTTSLSNLTLKDENGVTVGTPVGLASASQNYSVNMVVAKGTTKRIDVFANISTAVNGNTIIPKLTVTYTGSISNQTTTPAAVTGDTITIATIAVQTPTISSKIASRYVLGSSSQQVVVFNATSNYGSATINDMTFTVTNGVQSVVVNGITASVIGSTAIAYGVNLNIPAGSAGVNIPVTVNYTPVYSGSIASNSGVVSGTTATVSWTTAKITDASGAITNPTLSLSANTMTLVASMPTVTAVSNSGTYLGVNSSTVSNVKIGSISVSADKAGDIVVGKISYNLNTPATASNVAVKVSGSVAQDKNGVSANTATANVITFNNGYRITAGSSVIFDIYADVAPVATNGGSTSVALGSASLFSWSDDASTTGRTASAYDAVLLGTNYAN